MSELAISDPLNWIRGTGIEVIQGMGLGLASQRVIDEDFSSAINSALWDEIKVGNGDLIIGLDESVKVYHPTASDLACLVSKNNPDDSLPFRLQWTTKMNTIAPSGTDFLLSGYSATPTPDDIGTRRIFTFWRNTGQYELIYVDDTGTLMYWNGVAWQAGSTGFTFTLDAWYIVQLISNGTSWKLRLEDNDGALITETASVNWNDQGGGAGTFTKQLAGGESNYMMLGEIRKVLGLHSLRFERFILWATEEAIDYSTLSPVAISPFMAIDQDTFDPVTAIVFLINKVAALLGITNVGNVRFQYDLNALGFNATFLTLAQLNAALISRAITDHLNSIRYMIQFNSDGIQPVDVTGFGSFMQASGGVSCDYPIVTDVRAGIPYDFGNLVGTYVPADVDKYLNGFQYGANGVEFTGTFGSPDNAVIDGYIMPMVAELVRDQVALIVTSELTALKARAIDLAANEPGTLQGIQAQKDLDDNIYDIIDNIFIEKGTHFMDDQMPGLNIFYGRSDYSSTEGNNINEQESNTNYTIEAHVEEKHEKKNGVTILGDKKSAKNTTRVLGLIRGILMSGDYYNLGDQFADIVERRRVSSIDVFQPDFQESNGRHGIVGILNIAVNFKELGPEVAGQALASTINFITSKLHTADDGKVITIET